MVNSVVLGRKSENGSVAEAQNILFKLPHNLLTCKMKRFTRTDTKRKLLTSDALGFGGVKPVLNMKVLSTQNKQTQIKVAYQ